MTIDIEKEKQVLAALERERQEQEERLQRAKEAPKQFTLNMFCPNKQLNSIGDSFILHLT